MTVTTGSFVAKDGAGNDVELPKYAPGRAAAAAAAPVALSTEDLAALTDIAARLATITGHVDGLEGLATSLNGYVDGLETLQGTTNTSLAGLSTLATALNGYVDGLETLQGTTNTSLTAISGYVDGLEALHATLNGYVDGLEALAAAATPAGTNLIGKVGIDQTTDGTTNKVNIDASLKSGTATASTPAQTTTSGAVLASNANRKGATIYNPNAGALLLNLAGGNAATVPHTRLAQYASYEVGSGYTGAITGALETGTGNANVVEFT